MGSMKLPDDVKEFFRKQGKDWRKEAQRKFGTGKTTRDCASCR